MLTSKNSTLIVRWSRKSNVQGVLKKWLNLLWILIWNKNTNWKISINFWNEVLLYQMPRDLSKSLPTPLKTLLLKENCQNPPDSNIYTMIPFHWENWEILVITTPTSRRNSTSYKNEQNSSSKDFYNFFSGRLNSKLVIGRWFTQ